jgi:hypothetical protein
MSNDVTVTIGGETTVPEAVDKSKKAMGQMENALVGMNKKMENFGKDLILSYIAPMVLLNKAFDYVSQKIEENKQKAKEALDFAAKGESKELDPATIKMARNMQEQANRIEEQAKAATARAIVTEDFLRNATDKDKERLHKRLGPLGAFMYEAGFGTYEDFSKNKSIQDAVRDIQNANIMREEEANRKVKDRTGLDTLGVQNAVFGIGTSPLIGALNEQLEQQKRQTVLLEQIADKTPSIAGDSDYTKAPPYYPRSSIMNRAP